MLTYTESLLPYITCEFFIVFLLVILLVIATKMFEKNVFFYRFRMLSNFVHIIFQYFSKNGVPRVPTKYELFNEVTGLDLSLEAEGSDFLQQVLHVLFSGIYLNRNVNLLEYTRARPLRFFCRGDFDSKSHGNRDCRVDIGKYKSHNHLYQGDSQ